MPYSTASNKTDKFGNVLKSSIAQLVYKKKNGQIDGSTI